ncbi:helix-turn-helix domain-containing protein [Pedobacter sp. Hv1]|uniref:helix-turn-helix domain-containing protein n=1 Tax=Pedobacter sp. Hv1 TaxID=1740090 RepID=UPI0006D8AE22|nr:helix-turn-helix domain-containing protein [Pedobacter sp. Hv1]KQC00451.1 hypothetical protein AQF98_13320 [Pedobacter sp. Hv1]
MTHTPLSKPEPQVITQVLAALSHYHPLSTPLKEAFTQSAFNLVLKQGEYLMRQEEACHQIYFLVQGIVSGYRRKGLKKLITFITVSGELISPISGMYGLGPAGENMVAEEDCLLIGISVVDILRFFELFPEMNIVVRKILENHYKNAHERAVINKMGTAKEKYAYYLKILPNHHNRVPIQLAANFLDIKLQTLLNTKKTHQLQEEFSAATKHQLHVLTKAMKEDKIFQQKKISLNAIAAQLNLSTHQLSSLINEHYQQNFTDFINTYRINFIKDQLRSKANFQQTTIEALGYEAGFSSKSSFFAVFKKQTGLSPLSFANTLNRKK